MEFKVGDRVCFEYYGDIKFGIIRDICEEDVYPIIVYVNGKDLDFCFLEDGRLDFGSSVLLKHVSGACEQLRF